MRIAIVTETWRPHVDGVVTRLSETIRCLRQRGHEVLVIAPEGGDSSFQGAQVRGVATFRISFVHGGQPWGFPLPRVGTYLDRFRPDVVHAVNPIMLGIAGVLAARRRGLPLVCSYHTDLTGYATYYRLGWLTGAIRGLTRGLHSAAGVNLATSSAACHRLRSLGASNVHLWRRGVDLDLFRPERRQEAARERLGAAEGEPLAVCVGRISPEKKLHDLEPLARDDRIRLALVGDGPARDELRRRFRGMRVSFPGMLHGADLAAAYAAADVFVFPATTEVNPLVLLEAMATGLPVLAADSAASRELLQHHPQARLFAPDERPALPRLLTELLSDDDSPQYAFETRRAVEGWSWSAATRQLLDFYRAAQRDAERGADARSAPASYQPGPPSRGA